MKCQTLSRGQRARGFLLLTLPLALHSAACAQEIRSTNGGGLWNNPLSWQRISGTGGVLPNTGDRVIITAGNPITLNTNVGIGSLARLEIHDTLTVRDIQPYKLGASRIDVGGPVSFLPVGSPEVPGALLIGSQTTPFQNTIAITLTDTFLSSDYKPTLPLLENKSFFVHGGSNVQMHGRNVDSTSQPRKSWLRLANNPVALAPGATSMVLESAPGWAIGDVLVITGTDFAADESEVVRITGITGATVQFTPPLTKRHNSAIELGLVDERAEVGLLTHNILITSPVSTSAAGIKRGGHFMVQNEATTPPLPNPTINIAQTCFQNLGWQGATGRYPVHIHELRSMSGSWLRSCSVWLNHHRAIAIHGSDDFEVSDCVTYETLGHSIYLEDRSEKRNQLLRNLVIKTRIPPPGPGGVGLGGSWQPTPGSPAATYFHGSDPQVSAFWITNTENSIIGNVACDSEKHGYWLDPSTNVITVPTTPPFTVGAGLWQSPPVVFRDNVAHSNAEHGFWNDFARLVAIDPALNPPQAAEHLFVNFTAYKNRFGGIWARSYGTSRWMGARLADNRLGAYLASEGFQTDGLPVGPPFNTPFLGAPCMSLTTMENSVVIGESTNNPTALPVTALPYLERKGVELYDGLILLLGVQFHNFQTTSLGTTIPSPGGPMTHRVAMAITSQSFHSVDVPGDPWAVDPRAGLFACSFTNCSHAVLFPVPHAPGSPAIAGVHNAIPGVPTWAPNGVTSAMILDVTGSVPGNSPGSYVINDTPLLNPAAWVAPTPLFGHYAPPVFVPGPGTANNDAYAAFQFMIESTVGGTPVNTAVNFIRLRATRRGPTNTLDVFDGERCALGATHKRFPANVLLARPGNREHYEVDYPAGATPPAVFELKLQFSDKGRSAMFGVQYSPTTPPTSVLLSHILFPGVTIPLTPVSSRAAVESGTGLEYFHDTSNGRIWLRPTLLDLSGLGLGVTPLHPLLSGRAMTISVQ